MRRLALLSVAALAACSSTPPSTTVLTLPSASPSAAASAPSEPAADRPRDMVSIPAGSFTMGTDGVGDNTPAHEVTVAAFQIDRNEVTVGAYRACVQAGQCTPALNPGGGACNYDDKGTDRQPINCVDWNQATAFCAARGLRLPTEEEWEYAARGKEGLLFPWGDDEPTGKVCFSGKEPALETPCDVGTSPLDKSPFGVMDMAGNMQEWVSSSYCPYPEKKCSETKKVRRGGAWGYGDWRDLSSIERTSYPPGHRYDFLGFRCAK